MHHAEALAEEANDEVVHEEGEEGSVGKVAEKHRVDVALVESVRAKREVIHVGEHVVRWPHQVHPVHHTVRCDHCKSNVSIWEP